MRMKLSFGLMVLAGLILGCASTGSSTKGKGSVSFNGKAGSATAPDLRVKTERMLTRYQFEVVRQEETFDSFYFETNWRFREPFSDETAQNVASARTRIIIQTRPKSRAVPISNSADVHSVQVIGENQVKYAGSEEWVNMPMTEELKAYFRKFCSDLEHEFQSGLSRF